jgi:hypothetical protein
LSGPPSIRVEKLEHLMHSCALALVNQFGKQPHLQGRDELNQPRAGSGRFTNPKIRSEFPHFFSKAFNLLLAGF